MPYPLSELDEIPGTTVFTAKRSREAYHLHKFCMSLMEAANRDAFRADERAFLDRFRMSDEQKQAYRVSARAFLGTLVAAGEGWAKGV